MRTRIKKATTGFIAALIVALLFVVAGKIAAQDTSQNMAPSPGQMQNDQPQNDQTQNDQTQNQDPNQDQDVMQNQAPASSSNSQDSTQDQNQREPMSELPPKPSPNIGPYGPEPGDAGPGGGGPNGSAGNSSNTSDSNGVARISLIHGDVSTQRGDSGDWSAAQLNGPLVAGDKISTGDKARTEVQLDYANILRLAEHTQANIVSLTRKQIQIQLGHGMANFTVLRNSDADAEIDTPNVAIRTERREASFRILVTAADHTEVLVRKGEVEITTPQGGTRVGANQFITIRGTGDQEQYRIGEAPARDDWDQWNTDRDRMINNSPSRGRTNDYYTGTQDLDANGTWQNVPDYGSAWFPNVPPGWAPYSAGSWVWEPYWGWTWVSYEPWGWAPYHYGRWFLYNGAWGWWPGPVYPYYRPLWAPAYVSFFGFGPGFGFGWGWGSIGWFPIGPCDFFHPWWGRFGGHFGYTGWAGYNHGGFAPLHGGTRFSNVRLAMNDPHFNGASSVAGNQFGKGHTTLQRVSHASLQNAHFATGNLPVTPSRQSLSASGRPAASGTVNNRAGSQHFFSTHGTTSAASGRSSFEHEQAQLSSAMRQSGVSPVNTNRNNDSRTSENRMNDNHSTARSSESAPRDSSRSDNDATRSSAEARANSGPARNANTEAGRESSGNNNGGWQKFGPMPPRSSAEQSAERSSSGAAREQERSPYGASRGYPGSESRSPYGGSRPPLNMRQPIVTPRSYGGRPGGYPGGGGHAPSFGGHSAPSGHGGGSSHGGGGGHSGGGGHGGHR